MVGGDSALADELWRSLQEAAEREEFGPDDPPSMILNPLEERVVSEHRILDLGDIASDLGDLFGGVRQNSTVQAGVFVCVHIALLESVLYLLCRA